MTMSDGIAVMNGGRVEQIGAPREIYDRPAKPVRRRVHRPRNILPVTIGKARDGIAEVGLGGMRFPVPDRCRVPAGPGHLALRHERIRIGPALGEARRGSAVIRDVVFSGPDVQYVLAGRGHRAGGRGAAMTAPGCPRGRRSRRVRLGARRALPVRGWLNRRNAAAAVAAAVPVLVPAGVRVRRAAAAVPAIQLLPVPRRAA